MAEQTVASTRAQMDRLQLELQDLKHAQGVEDITVGDYLLARLDQLQITNMFGLPGDFNLGFLDLVEDHPNIHWVGNCNELNSGYAADGYARVKPGSMGVLLTTFGVGELSAVNAIAGSYAEMVPVLHIVGAPSTSQQLSKPLLHHTLGDSRYEAYAKAYEQFTCCQKYLMNKETAAADIDHLLTEILVKARPGYMTLPTNLVFEKISGERLKTPLSHLPPPNDPEVEAHVVEEIVKHVMAANGGVAVLVDACAVRHDVTQELLELINKTHLPVYSTPMGKTAIPENYDRYGGIYIGSISRPEIREKLESASIILSVGGLRSDYNSGNFTYNFPVSRTIELHSDHTKVFYAQYPAIGMKQLIPKLTAKLEPFKETTQQIAVPQFKSVFPTEDTEIITQAWFWPTMGEFFRPKDVIIAETGTASFGITNVAFPPESIFIAQIFWGSIGYSVGSTLGAALGAQDRNLGRTILFVGDGSLQLTVQEFSTMLRMNLKPIVFVLNNNGYTIERWLHGKERKYNDIFPWAWTDLLKVFGDKEELRSKSYTVHNKKELSALLADEKFARADKMQLVEVMMDQFDAPVTLVNQAELSGKTNAYVPK
ncbi:thiamine diphosphate-binding protein [Schizophyllum amplum]|uniref:Thiamine diphosphate-binding protein n=1 Tax=Schizophyllum amplum TaxID=97359 RepID=A0A550C6E8_9AGAR|nr:thiamine diphosphate-binding protein [Auriculariopsis ampla]